MKIRFLAPVLILFIASCSSYVYTISPSEGDIDHNNDKEIVYQSDSLYESSANFENYSDDNMVFFFYFYNKSDSAVTIDPADFLLTYYKNKTDYMDNNPEYTKYFIDPEMNLEMIETEIKDVHKEAKNKSCLNCLFSAVIVAKALIDDDDYDDAGEIAAAAANLVINEENIKDEEHYKTEQLKEKLKFYENSILKKTTLYPGEETGGIALVKQNLDCRSLVVEIPLGNLKHIYYFEQQKIKR